MPSATRVDPLTTGRFQVEIDGLTLTTLSHITGISASIEVLDSHNSSTARTMDDTKQPGVRKLSNIVLKRGLTSDTSLWQWFHDAEQGNLARHNGRITLLNSVGQPVVSWTFSNGWPCKWSGPDLDAAGNGVAIETLEITHEGLQMVGV